MQDPAQPLPLGAPAAETTTLWQELGGFRHFRRRRATVPCREDSGRRNSSPVARRDLLSVMPDLERGGG